MRKWLIILVLSFLGTGLFAQCPMCKATAEGSSYAKKLNVGILYLLAFPIVLAGGAGTFWYYNRNKFHEDDNRMDDDLLSNINPN